MPELTDINLYEEDMRALLRGHHRERCVPRAKADGGGWACHCGLSPARLKLREALNGANTATLSPLDGEPASHSGGPATERSAARKAWPRAASARLAVLVSIGNAGGAGRTADELRVALDLETAARRLSDLKAGGWVEVLVDAACQRPITRQTRSGAQAEVYVLTPDARERLARG